MEMKYFRPAGKNSAVNLALLAIMTALATIMTFVIRIPYPGTGGYFNFGDIIVMLGGLLLGPVGGFFVGGVGSAIADIIGFPLFAPITLIVKGFEGMAVGYLGSRAREHVRLNVRDAIAVLVGAIIMLIGYFLGEVFFLGIPVEMAIVELVTINLVQVAIGGSVTLLIGPNIRSYLRTINYGQPEPLEEPDESENV
ncbi:MAG: ECF transporter S component [Candidatus Thorarchaeota archaeon]|nr:MAG: ECF transporter S component [Candidatus Thorarchaeota archaeon]